MAGAASTLSSAEFTENKQHDLTRQTSVSHQHGVLGQQEPPADSKAEGNISDIHSAESVLLWFDLWIYQEDLLRQLYVPLVLLSDREQSPLSDFSQHH